jgi:uncharacterized membrane protein YqjE
MGRDTAAAFETAVWRLMVLTLLVALANEQATTHAWDAATVTALKQAFALMFGFWAYTTYKSCHASTRRVRQLQAAAFTALLVFAGAEFAQFPGVLAAFALMALDVFVDVIPDTRDRVANSLVNRLEGRFGPEAG